ncbi:sugar transferase [Cyclobacterium marinum]|uniref:Sugar transferase n=1 Tax=Cyclobacterium marinum (strain ATCC 25205 / DSM 745 / LMG 13164 / NCIMB 1802) TaxID=880070 RepID=G0J248_CYCMS|nr:sugar transferase [Cyclobacterium marinum]AEL24557.1 sugar transferase [Cyclobacterium marinum DSM 745]
MEKFLQERGEPEFLSRKLSGYITPDGRVFLSDGFNLLVKRGLDLAFSLFFIVVVMSWLFPIIALIIRLESRGPIIYKQLRHGRGNKTFRCYKFRTSVKINKVIAKGGPQRDFHITRFGKFLRKSGLDEIPQFINVFLGDMSVVGPRPHAVPMNYMYSTDINNYMFRHVVKPGITGLAQIKGYSGEILSFYDIYGRIKLDHFYIKNWSLVFDFKILFWTVGSYFGRNRVSS